MVVLVPPPRAGDVVPGSLVVIGKLKSTRGKRLNGKCAVVRGNTESGRIHEEIIGRRDKTRLYPENAVPCVNLKL